MGAIATDARQTPVSCRFTARDRIGISEKGFPDAACIPGACRPSVEGRHLGEQPRVPALDMTTNLGSGPAIAWERRPGSVGLFATGSRQKPREKVGPRLHTERPRQLSPWGCVLGACGLGRQRQYPACTLNEPHGSPSKAQPIGQTVACFPSHSDERAEVLDALREVGCVPRPGLLASRSLPGSVGRWRCVPRCAGKEVVRRAGHGASKGGLLAMAAREGDEPLCTRAIVTSPAGSLPGDWG